MPGASQVSFLLVVRHYFIHASALTRRYLQKSTRFSLSVSFQRHRLFYILCINNSMKKMGKKETRTCSL
jgi:hypothetical protein